MDLPLKVNISVQKRKARMLTAVLHRGFITNDLFTSINVCKYKKVGGGGCVVVVILRAGAKIPLGKGSNFAETSRKQRSLKMDL